MKTILLCFSSAIFLAFACSSTFRKVPRNMENKDIPGIVFTDSKFGVDETEITNFNWMEFLYWTGKKYGSESTEYQSILPDTNVWTAMDKGYLILQNEYLRHPAFRNYPVVGISYEQAKAFCEWRSDRVFEYHLIRQHVISWDYSLSSNSDSLVTIDRYKKGLIKGIKPSPEITKFPLYRLPSKQEWERSMVYLEQRAMHISKREKKLISSNSVPEIFHDLPMPNSVAPDKYKYKSKPNWMFYLDRNVSEWLSDGKSIAGENGKGTVEIAEHENTSQTITPSATIGFRCVFEWQ